MAKTKAGVVLLTALLAASQPALSQQPPLSTRVQVEGFSEVLEALTRIERGLELLLFSRWEYLIEQRNLLGEDILDRIDELGRDGWELVSVTADGSYILKRRVAPR